MSNGLYKKKIASEGKSATKDFESDKVSGHHGRVALAMIAGFACSRAISAVMFTGFGLDESYSVAISRTFTLSYFDHPPLHQLKQSDSGVPVAELCRQHGMSSAAFYRWRSKYGGMDVSMMSEKKALEDENRRLKRMFADLSMQNELLKEAIGKK